ncbi:MAG: DotU family type IV/VI secretion system protein [Acidobacteria bacterium]|nr:DotU family type IV/VI secretion system protein [Acidobacteriota bacterium]
MSSSPAVYQAPRRNLALCLQEVFTVIVRLRARRHQVSDAGVFREQVKDALGRAEQEARSKGYTAEDTKKAIFAAVAFLDETVLNLQDPVFGDWMRRPLQQELYGVDFAGDVFFRGAERLLASDDTPELADMLEAYYLCLLLGFSGRYSNHGAGDLQHITDKIGRRIYQLRGERLQWPLPTDIPQETESIQPRDPWIRRLQIVTACAALLAIGLFVAYMLSLSSLSNDLRQFAATFGA